jgi:hypothetical protein
VVFLSYNLIAGNAMKEIYDFARYDFYVRHYFKIATNNEIQCLCWGQFLEKNQIHLWHFQISETQLGFAKPKLGFNILH